jgi:hypothetical protein
MCKMRGVEAVAPPLQVLVACVQDAGCGGCCTAVATRFVLLPSNCALGFIGEIIFILAF